MQHTKLLALSAGMMVSLGLATAHADSGVPTPLAVEVDVSATEPDQHDAIAATLALVGDHGCADVMQQHGSVTYEINVCRQSGEGAAPILSFKINRKDGPSVTKFEVGTRLALGKRMMIGKFQRGPGAVMEVSATAR